jgi:hypothetical protein
MAWARWLTNSSSSVGLGMVGATGIFASSRARTSGHGDWPAGPEAVQAYKGREKLGPIEHDSILTGRKAVVDGVL